jgi:hypothetical protein
MTAAFQTKCHSLVNNLFYKSDGSAVGFEYPQYFNGSGRAIPKFLYRTAEYTFNKLPPVFAEILVNTSLNNPGYKVYYFSKDDRRAFVQSMFPDYVDCYDSLLPGAYQADVFRLLILYAFGGIYNDIGQRFMKKLGDVLHHDDEFVSVKEINNWGINQGFIASYPRHPLVKKMIQVVIDMVKRRDYSDCPIDVTGPYAVFRAFNKFFNKKPYTPLTGGSQLIDGYRVRFLYHRGGQSHEIKYICVDPECAELLVQNKFAGYREMLQNMSGTQHYMDLWKARKVFVDSNHTSGTCIPVSSSDRKSNKQRKAGGV